MSNIKVKPGRYRHFRGKFYEVIGVARDSENTDQLLVVYRALYTSEEFGKNQLWIRPVKGFLENVEVEGETIPRFRFVGDESSSSSI